MNSVDNYLTNSHHMSPEELVSTLESLLDIDFSTLPKQTLNQLNLQLDADNSNADLFYDPDTAQHIHHLINGLRHLR